MFVPTVCPYDLERMIPSSLLHIKPSLLHIKLLQMPLLMKVNHRCKASHITLPDAGLACPVGAVTILQPMQCILQEQICLDHKYLRTPHIGSGLSRPHLVETCLLHHSPDSIAGNMLGYILCHITNLMKMMVVMMIIREDQQEKKCDRFGIAQLGC